MTGMRAATEQLMQRSVDALVEAGYAVVLSDSRGTGYAEGTYDYYNIEGGPFDGYDTVEWIAEQPWCDGNVGLWGLSGSAVLAYAAALTSPPHLKAVAAYMCPADFYLDQWYPGGMFRYEDRMRWPMLMQDCIAPLDPGPADGPAYERKRLVFEQRYYRHYERMTRGLNPVPLDWATQCVSHDSYDEFWQARSFDRQLAGVTAPVLNVGVLHDHFIRGTMRFHEGLSVPRRLLLVPGALDTGRQRRRRRPGRAADQVVRLLPARHRERRAGRAGRAVFPDRRPAVDGPAGLAGRRRAHAALPDRPRRRQSGGDGGLAWSRPAGQAPCCSRTTPPPRPGHPATPATSGRSGPAPSPSPRPRWSATSRSPACPGWSCPPPRARPTSTSASGSATCTPTGRPTC